MPTVPLIQHNVTDIGISDLTAAPGLPTTVRHQLPTAESPAALCGYQRKPTDFLNGAAYSDLGQVEDCTACGALAATELG